MISSILLAAGQSKRMNGENKLIKNIKGLPLIKHSVTNILESSIDELIIITGHQNLILEKLINKNKKIKIIFNRDFKSGIASSIKLGIKNLSERTQAFFICLADMPMINKNIYNKLIKHVNIKEIIIPTYKKKQGNPILFSVTMKDEIMSIKGDFGAKKLIKKNKKKTFNLEINDQAILKNYNTLDSFEN